MGLALDSRLSIIAEMVRENARVVDVGTDHGYLVCSLVASGKCPSGYACDINIYPLEKAKKQIASCGLEDKIHAVLSDGLEKIPPDEIDDIVIAGMGGDLIWSIISKQEWTKNEKYRFVIQPMTKPDKLRRFLYEGGFEIIREQTSEAGMFVYCAMLVKYTGVSKTIDDFFACTGTLAQHSEYTSADKKYFRRAAYWVLKEGNGLLRSGKDDLKAHRLIAMGEKIAKMGEGIEEDQP
ncbi:MAG TPA: SAM-dependent methyltransferase [Ruminococcaceae bacterium]|nr:SAM-dependent methyltransferase [Oscillospiraceae bacterium]